MRDRQVMIYKPKSENPSGWVGLESRSHLFRGFYIRGELQDNGSCISGGERLQGIPSSSFFFNLVEDRWEMGA